MVRLSILLAGCLLDALLGDPYSLPHPIRWMGRLIAWLEKVLRPLCPKTARGERVGGTVMVLLVLAVTIWCTAILLCICKRFSFWLWWAVSAVICYYMLAARSLAEESGKVYRALQSGTLEEAREAVSRIVGRDTAQLDRAGVARAAVETVAENTSDGVVAPLVYMAIGGPVWGAAYKAVNTMDSMVGYHNERYENWGRTAAKLDDLVNFLPARLAGAVMCAAATLCGLDGRSAWRVFRRDRLNHKSPNSAHTEAACAGALHLQLGGNSFYFGKLVEKPTIGDDLRLIQPEDIRRANRLMSVTACLTAALAGLGILLCEVLLA
ncbi:MAG: adenosylcobinamide-phosphate synthase CbiB [Clostridiales bacterium]|nr:adenosylcobinamide-phosphate synthase CbiB [Clostridiales bacterium]